MSTEGAVIEIEVAEIGSRFVPDPDAVDAEAMPTRGDFFVTEGYLYPTGTLTCSEVACDGVVHDAAGNPAPELPEM